MAYEIKIFIWYLDFKSFFFKKIFLALLIYKMIQIYIVFDKSILIQNIKVKLLEYWEFRHFCFSKYKFTYNINIYIYLLIAISFYLLGRVEYNFFLHFKIFKNSQDNILNLWDGIFKISLLRFNIFKVFLTLRNTVYLQCKK